MSNFSQEQQQQMFETMFRHVYKQGRRSFDEKRQMCSYRSPTDGLKCAVGCLIPDDKYDPRMEGGVPSTSPTILNAIGVNVDDWETIKFLDNAQVYLHDTLNVNKVAELNTVEFKNTLMANAIRLAMKFGLSYSFLTEFPEYEYANGEINNNAS